MWVRIQGLQSEWFDDGVMKQIVDLIGTIPKVDPKTTSHSRGKYARICVEFDLQKPLVPKVKY